MTGRWAVYVAGQSIRLNSGESVFVTIYLKGQALFEEGKAVCCVLGQMCLTD